MISPEIMIKDNNTLYDDFNMYTFVFIVRNANACQISIVFN